MTPLFLLLLSSGCSTYRHERTLDVGGKEVTSFRTFLVWGNAARVHASVADGEYKRTLSVGTVSGGTDSEAIKAIFEGAVKGAVEGAKSIK